MNASLEFCGNSIVIRDFVHSIEDEQGGNPYNCSFSIRVVSGEFSGLASGCECDYKEFKEFVTQLSELVDFKRSEVEFREIGYGSVLKFVGDERGHIEVSGKIYGKAMIHSMEFEFVTDQTVYKSFINELSTFE